MEILGVAFWVTLFCFLYKKPCEIAGLFSMGWFLIFIFTNIIVWDNEVSFMDDFNL